MPLSWLKARPVPAPSDLELELVDALEAVTQCVDERSACDEVASQSRQVLQHAKEKLGIAS